MMFFVQGEDCYDRSLGMILYSKWTNIIVLWRVMISNRYDATDNVDNCRFSLH